MKKGAIRFQLVLWGIVLFLLLCFAGFMMTKADNGFGGFHLNIFSGGDPKYTLLDEAYDAQGLSLMDVRMVSDTIEILAEGREDVQVTYLCSEDDMARCPIVTVENGAIVIESPRNFRLISLGRWPGRLTVRVPERLALGYKLSSTSGSLTVDGVRMTRAQISGVSGSIHLSPDLSSRASAIDVSNTSGSLRIAANADALHASTVSGSVRAEGSFGTVDASTTSGSVRINCWTAPSSVNLESVSGSTRLTLPRDVAGFALDTSSVSGKLHNDFGENPYGDRSTVVRLHTVSGGMYVSPAESEDAEREDDDSPSDTSKGAQRSF